MSVKTLNTDVSILLVRIATGGLMIFHGIAKLIKGHEGIKTLLAQKGLPEFLWVGVPVGEIIAPILLILGIYSRISGLFLAIVMLFSIYLAKTNQIFDLTQNGGLEIELNLFYLFCGLAIFFSGSGKYSVYKPKNDLLR